MQQLHLWLLQGIFLFVIIKLFEDFVLFSSLLLQGTARVVEIHHSFLHHWIHLKSKFIALWFRSVTTLEWRVCPISYDKFGIQPAVGIELSVAGKSSVQYLRNEQKSIKKQLGQKYCKMRKKGRDREIILGSIYHCPNFWWSQTNIFMGAVTISPPEVSDVKNM